MQFKAINRFDRGLFSKRGTESKIGDNFLTKLINLDIDITGRLTRRWGYEYWFDLTENNSVASSQDIPDVVTKTGFKNRVQAIYPYQDVGGNKYIFVVSNGKVYMEKIQDGEKVWICLNPVGNIEIEEKVKHSQITTYLDIVFFNDYQNNVYMYNTQAYSASGWTINGVRGIYFAGDKIYYRNFTDWATEYHTHAITDITDASDDIIHVTGDYRHNFAVGDTVTVEGNSTPANNTIYTVKSVVYDSGDNETDVEINGGMDTPATVDGNLKSSFRIWCDSADGTNSGSLNYDGKAMYDSLVDSSYIAPSGGVITDPTDLKLGFCIRAGNETSGFFYYVLDNQLNQRADDKCYIIKFNDRFICQDFTSIDIDATGEIANFTLYDGNIYIWGEDTKIKVINISTFDVTTIDTGHIASIDAPVNTTSDKLFSIAVDANGIYLPCQDMPTLPDDYMIHEIARQWFWTEKNYSSFSAFINGIDRLISANNNLYVLARYVTIPPITDATIASINPSDFSIIDYGAFYNGYAWDLCDCNNKIWSVGYNDIWSRYEIQYQPYDLSTYNETTLPYKPYRCFAEGSSYVWITCNRSTDKKIMKINTSTYAVTSIDISSHASSSVFGIYYNNYIWTGCYPSKLLKINPSTHAITSYTVDGGGIEIIGAFNYLWIANYTLGQVQKIDPSTGNTLERIKVGDNVLGITADANYIYASVKNSSGDSEVVRINPTTHNKINFACPFYPNKLALLNNKVYASEYLNTVDDFWGGGNIIKEYDVDLTDFTKLVSIDDTGDFRNDSSWNRVYLMGTLTKLKYVSPAYSDGNILYFGVDGIDGTEWGLYNKLNLSTFAMENKYSFYASKRYPIYGDTRWFLKGHIDDDTFRISGNWIWADGFTVYDDFYDLDTYDSNMVYHINKVNNEFTGDTDEIDKLQYLGTPKTIIPSLNSDSSSSDKFIRGTFLKYQLAFVLSAGQTTNLGASTEAIEIPQLHASQTIDSFTNGSNEIDLVGHGYVDDDIVWLSNSGGSLPAELSKETDYYVKKVDDDNFQVSLTKGGSAVSFTDDGSGTSSVIRIDQDVQVLLTDINLENIYGTDIYNQEDVASIQIYRSQKNYGETLYADPVLLGTLTHNGTGWIYGALDYETFEDNLQTLSYNTFDESNVIKYPVDNIVVHKNRLVLVNRIDYENPNVIQYSSIDLADAIPVDNIRPIESGDGDVLVAGVSTGDYLYLFKRRRIYAILGDVEAGQLIDVSKSVGTEYSNMVCQYNNIVYFMNDVSIYSAYVGAPVTDLASKRLDTFFDKDIFESIDFLNIKENGYTIADTENMEIRFYVPLKEGISSQNYNNACIIYNIRDDNCKVYQYHDNLFMHSMVNDIETNELMHLVTDYSGNIYRLGKHKNDNFNPVKWLMVTKHFDIDTKLIRKNYKTVKIVGSFLNSMRINYYTDKVRQNGNIFKNGDDIICDIWNGNNVHTIALEISGENYNTPPEEIEEILIGYTTKKGMR